MPYLIVIIPNLFYILFIDINDIIFRHLSIIRECVYGSQMLQLVNMHESTSTPSDKEDLKWIFLFVMYFLVI